MSRTGRSVLTDEQREQRRAQHRKLTIDSVEQLRSSDGWKAYLRARRSFHDYSVGNLLMIVMQHPTATTVAGFKAWIKLGYCVRKGQTGIGIWAPCPPTRKELAAWHAAGGDPAEQPKTRWRIAHVFAQDQVDPLPPPAQPAPLEHPGRQTLGDTHADLLTPLTNLAAELGYTVSIAPLANADGLCAPKPKQIILADRLSPNARVSVAIHEIAHALIRAEPADSALSYAQEELVVESIAFLVCDLVGLDTSENSIPYLASWAQDASLEILEATVKLTDRLARRIEDSVLLPAAGSVSDEFAAAA